MGEKTDDEKTGVNGAESDGGTPGVGEALGVEPGSAASAPREALSIPNKKTIWLHFMGWLEKLSVRKVLREDFHHHFELLGNLPITSSFPLMS